MKIHDFYRMKQAGEKISMVTCYDYTSARLLSQTSVDCLLVGDSAAMTMHGHRDTIPATVEMMKLHTAAVSRGAGDKFIVSDMPFLTYRSSRTKNVASVRELMQAGAHAVKLEGAAGNIALIRHLTESGIPVMGHLGLTLQHMHMLGGFKVQGKTDESAKQIKEDALALQQAGCFAIVLECMPNEVAQEITNALTVPTIGIGAGPVTDGQVLVFQDLLGLNMDFKPKFVKQFMNGALHVKQSVDGFVDEVKSGVFPNDEHCYQR
jgi:3-methyl-2-oxobutanoate hydroxymethyltransferase